MHASGGVLSFFGEREYPKNAAQIYGLRILLRACAAEVVGVRTTRLGVLCTGHEM